MRPYTVVGRREPRREGGTRAAYELYDLGVAAAAFVEHDRSSLSPVDVADELAVQLTHRGYFDGRRRFSLGVRALAEGAARLAEEPEDHIAQMNYMQCGAPPSA